MIIWLSSYPKSGNTYIRSFLSAYYFSKDGNFNFNLLLNINQFPGIHFSKNKMDSKLEASKNWILNQNIYFDKNKLKILKTHNSLTPYEQNKFTSKDQTLGAIYICRDPRNVITSLKNHFEMSYEESLKFMVNERKYTYDYFKKNDFSDFQFLSSWEKNYQTWINNKIFPILVIKYENLIKQTYEEFKKIIKFIDNQIDKDNEFDKKKALNALSSTSFSNLKKIENTKGFSEALDSKIKNERIPFFHLGPENNWKNKLDKNFQIKVNEVFKKNLQELHYL